ncbi:MAG: TonB-dependent receptor, partial [Saprospiraceae bacterium]
DLSFFVNALDSKTSGVDFVASYRGVQAGNGSLTFNLSGNYTLQNERDGDVKNPAIVAAAGQTVLNRVNEALFFTSRPKYKYILGVSYQAGKFGASLNNTLFGPTTFNNDGLDLGLYTEFDPKVVTDLGLTYKLGEKTTVALNVNNILNVLPKWNFKANRGSESLLNDAEFLRSQSDLITFSNRYDVMTYDGYHFSQLGTIFNLTVNVQF